MRKYLSTRNVFETWAVLSITFGFLFGGFGVAAIIEHLALFHEQRWAYKREMLPMRRRTMSPGASFPYESCDSISRLVFLPEAHHAVYDQKQTYRHSNALCIDCCCLTFDCYNLKWNG